MNAQLHLVLESKLLEKIQKEALEKKLSISELCRQKLRQNSQLDKIERMLEIMGEKLKN